MTSRSLRGDWTRMKAAVRDWWPRLTPRDVAAMSGQRDELMRKLKIRYEKTYGEIEREVTEFESHDVRSACAARPSRGILNDG